MNVFVCLAAILFFFMVLVGGQKGMRSFIALFLNFGVLFLTIFVMGDPTTNPIIVTLIACAVISCISLFYISELNIKTISAFISTIISFAILLFFILVVTDIASIQGFGEEEIEELSIFSPYIGIDFVKIGASVIIMSTIGAIVDLAISISSPMKEMMLHYPTSSRKDLVKFGISIGRDILGTSTNTLFFAFFGSYLGLLIWFKDLSYTTGEIMNSKVFSAEMITLLCSGIGVALTIPITAWVTAYVLVKDRAKQQHVHDKTN
ncbi:YibE/F family protein [Bacillus sp. CGMCC 1.16541]|uniref:YibE/F family protein n=1 Tax=Bacillus sp. CGMCC 1.16541 TaxID=2185143 RepID=UPI000D73D9BE|nr:YibE/F family protein [Bacillus sp. CGMCC 1.16541]